MKTLKRFWLLFLSLWPSKLPVSYEQNEAFCKSVLETFNLPDSPSYKNAICTMIMHLGPTTAFKSKFFFGLSIWKSMSNQVAYDVISQIREAEKAKRADEEKKTVSSANGAALSEIAAH